MLTRGQLLEKRDMVKSFWTNTPDNLHQPDCSKIESAATPSDRLQHGPSNGREARQNEVSPLLAGGNGAYSPHVRDSPSVLVKQSVAADGQGTAATPSVDILY